MANRIIDDNQALLAVGAAPAMDGVLYCSRGVNNSLVTRIFNRVVWWLELQFSVD